MSFFIPPAPEPVAYTAIAGSLLMALFAFGVAVWRNRLHRWPVAGLLWGARGAHKLGRRLVEGATVDDDWHPLDEEAGDGAAGQVPMVQPQGRAGERVGAEEAERGRMGDALPTLRRHTAEEPVQRAAADAQDELTAEPGDEWPDTLHNLNAEHLVPAHEPQDPAGPADLVLDREPAHRPAGPADLDPPGPEQTRSLPGENDRLTVDLDVDTDTGSGPGDKCPNCADGNCGRATCTEDDSCSCRCSTWAVHDTDAQGNVVAQPGTPDALTEAVNAYRDAHETLVPVWEYRAREQMRCYLDSMRRTLAVTGV